MIAEDSEMCYLIESSKVFKCPSCGGPKAVYRSPVTQAHSEYICLPCVHMAFAALAHFFTKEAYRDGIQRTRRLGD